MEKIDTRGNELNTFGNSSLSNHFECLKDNKTIYYGEGIEKSQEFLKNHNVNTITKTSTTAMKLSADQGRIGIKNLGNTCYMNSALQCLGHTRELLNYFISGEYRDGYPAGVCVELPAGRGWRRQRLALDARSGCPSRPGLLGDDDDHTRNAALAAAHQRRRGRRTQGAFNHQ